jgi:hypothetical protein
MTTRQGWLVLACLLLMSHAADAKGTTFPWLFNKFHGQLQQQPEGANDGGSNSGSGDTSACSDVCAALGDASSCDCSGCSCPEASCINAAMVCRRGNLTQLQLTTSCGAGAASVQLAQAPSTPGALQLHQKTASNTWSCDGRSCCSTQPGKTPLASIASTAQGRVSGVMCKQTCHPVTY